MRQGFKYQGGFQLSAQAKETLLQPSAKKVKEALPATTIGLVNQLLLQWEELAAANAKAWTAAKQWVNDEQSKEYVINELSRGETYSYLTGPCQENADIIETIRNNLNRKKITDKAQQDFLIVLFAQRQVNTHYSVGINFLYGAVCVEFLAAAFSPFEYIVKGGGDSQDQNLECTINKVAANTVVIEMRQVQFLYPKDFDLKNPLAEIVCTTKAVVDMAQKTLHWEDFTAVAVGKNPEGEAAIRQFSQLYQPMRAKIPDDCLSTAYTADEIKLRKSQQKNVDAYFALRQCQKELLALNLPKDARFHYHHLALELLNQFLEKTFSSQEDAVALLQLIGQIRQCANVFAPGTLDIKKNGRTKQVSLKKPFFDLVVPEGAFKFSRQLGWDVRALVQRHEMTRKAHLTWYQRLKEHLSTLGKKIPQLDVDKHVMWDHAYFTDWNSELSAALATQITAAGINETCQKYLKEFAEFVKKSGVAKRNTYNFYPWMGQLFRQKYVALIQCAESLGEMRTLKEEANKKITPINMPSKNRDKLLTEIDKAAAARELMLSQRAQNSDVLSRRGSTDSGQYNPALPMARRPAGDQSPLHSSGPIEAVSIDQEYASPALVY